MANLKSALLLVSILVPTAAACGSNKPEPVAASTPSPDTADAADAAPPSTSATVTSVPPASASGDGPSADAGAASGPAKSPVIIGETKDECTPVGVDFEKRARPKLKECYAEGKKKNPNLEGTVKIKITVDVKGKIKSTKILEKTLPDPVADCMLKVVKTTPFPEVDKCWDASLTIPITFPTPR